MRGIAGGTVLGSGSGVASAQTDASITHRVRSVLAIRPFRRLWGVSYICSIGDWLGMLALAGLVTKLTESYAMQNFAFSGVVLTQLLPGLLFAPIAGLLADRFDRRKVMVICDLLRCGLFMSIAFVGTAVWLFIANFLIGCCALVWIPSKESAIPNMLRRKDQVETANQLSLVMTWGISVITGAGLYAVITGAISSLRIQFDERGLGIASVIVVINGLLFLVSAILVATRIPEISYRPPGSSGQIRRADTDRIGPLAMLRDAARFIQGTRLIRGLLIGMIGTFAAAGALIGSAKPYASSLLGGDSAFGWLFTSLFVGLATGMATAPKVSRRLPHSRLFGVGIVASGIGLMLIALSPHLWISLAIVVLVGYCAGVAFLTGVTIIGTQVEDAVRGRINAAYQSMIKIILGVAMITVPLLIALVQVRTINVLGQDVVIDGTRPVLLGGGIVAALVGVIAYRQMDDRRSESILSDLVAAIRGKPTRTTGVLIAVEGDTVQDTATQARELVDWLRQSGTREVMLATDPALDDHRLQTVLSEAALSGARARALVAAAVRADIVEREIRPALNRGAVVVMERFVDSPLAHLSAVAGLDPAEMEGLTDWATARLRPDLTVLLDRDPSTLETNVQPAEQHWQVQHVLTQLAAADPARYLVVDADGAAEEIAERIRQAVLSRRPDLGGQDDPLLAEMA